MEFLYKDKAEDDLAYWFRTSKSVIKRIEALLKSIKETPFEGIGKPEPLRYDLSGYWSRRINREYRIIYKIEKDIVTIYSFRGHYTDK